jgi:hypothetical protein
MALRAVGSNGARLILSTELQSRNVGDGGLGQGPVSDILGAALCFRYFRSSLVRWKTSLQTLAALSPGSCVRQPVFPACSDCTVLTSVEDTAKNIGSLLFAERVTLGIERALGSIVLLSSVLRSPAFILRLFHLIRFKMTCEGLSSQATFALRQAHVALCTNTAPQDTSSFLPIAFAWMTLFGFHLTSVILYANAQLLFCLSQVKVALCTDRGAAYQVLFLSPSSPSLSLVHPSKGRFLALSSNLLALFLAGQVDSEPNPRGPVHEHGRCQTRILFFAQATFWRFHLTYLSLTPNSLFSTGKVDFKPSPSGSVYKHGRCRVAGPERGAV